VSTWDWPWDPLQEVNWTIFTNTHHMPNCFVLDGLKLGEGFEAPNTCPIMTHHISPLSQASLFPLLLMKRLTKLEKAGSLADTTGIGIIVFLSISGF